MARRTLSNVTPSTFTEQAAAMLRRITAKHVALALTTQMTSLYVTYLPAVSLGLMILTTCPLANP